MTSLTAIAAAFGSALAWSGLDALRKSLTGHRTPLAVGAALTAWFALIFGVWTLATGCAWPASEYWPPALFAVGLQALAHLGILESLRLAPISRTIPLLALTPLMATAASAVVLGESLTALQWTGMALAVAGAAGLGFSRNDAGEFRVDAGAVIMLVAAVAISASAPFDKKAVLIAGTQAHGLFQNIGIAVLLGSAAILRGLGRETLELTVRRPFLVLTAGVGVAAIALQLISYNGLMVGEVETIKRVVGIMLALLIGKLFFREAITRGTIFAAAVMTAGVVLVLLDAV